MRRATAHWLWNLNLTVAARVRRFVIPLGMMLGAEVTWSQFFFNNLIPVTLGNTIAGVLMMAIAYSISFGSLGKSAKPATA